MKKILIAFFVLVLFTGCNAVDDMKDMFNKQEKAQQLIKKNYGWNSQLGFNMSNGILTQVSVVLSADQVRDQSVANLEDAARQVISEVFKSNPKIIYIQIATSPAPVL